MNRREFVVEIGALGLVASIDQNAFASDPKSRSFVREQKSSSMPKTVAGVRLIDSDIARKATELSRASSPAYLFNHAMRTFLFGSLVGKASSQRFDEEALYLACVLHDIGLTDRYVGDHPFEIQGAEAAAKFLTENGYDKQKTTAVWDGIAMHPLAIGQYKQPEIALVGAGAGADVVGPDFDQIQKEDVDAVVAAFPRLQFKQQFVKTCADVVRLHPRAAGRTFMRDIAERHLPDYHPNNICDAIEKSPFLE